MYGYNMHFLATIRQVTHVGDKKGDTLIYVQKKT